MRVCLTVDLEQDCPPFLNTYRGIAEGLPQLAELLNRQAIPGTFFCTGDVARHSPDSIRELVSSSHELGCHGDTHRRFDTLTCREAEQEIRAATATLRNLAPVVSFRAPNLSFPRKYLPLLEAENYRLDSSQGKYKADYWLRNTATSVLRIPASITSSVLRLPGGLRRTLLGRLADPVVLFVHPWEFVDLRRSRLRWDCRFRTGHTALACLEDVIDFFRARQAHFVRMCDLLTSA